MRHCMQMKELQKLFKSSKARDEASEERRAQIYVMASRIVGCRMRDIDG